MIGAGTAVVGESVEHRRQVARGGGNVDVPGALRNAVDHVGDLRVAESPEPEAEVERRAEHHHQIGALLEQPAGAQERQLVAGRQHAPAQTVEEARHAQVLDRGAELIPRAVPVHIAANDEGRSLGCGDQ